MDCVYKVWCEWDIGLDYVVFMTREGAWEAATQGIEDIGEDVDQCKKDGLVGIYTWDIRE